jgi:hypothetical protein
MSLRETTREQICDALRTVPDEQLPEVMRFVESLRRPDTSATRIAEEPIAPLYRIHTAAIRTGIADLAHQHDHYLYGLDKRDA